MMDECIEDLYDAKQILLKLMITKVDKENICRIWKITDLRPKNKKHIYFIIIINFVSYLCSCTSNISRDIICQHYFWVIMNSAIAGFQIQMIPSR